VVQDGRVGQTPDSRIAALLEELCVRYGYCLPRDKADAIVAEPPADPQSFVDAVLKAEGLKLALVDRRTRGVLSEVVERWMFDSGTGEGTRSGLP
jgi:hypothetical protein